MFEWFILFGPALVGVFCAATTSSVVAGVACTAVAGGAGLAAAGAVEAFGVVMAMVIGFAGWLVVLIILLIFNNRIFKENALWFGLSLLGSEVPFLNSLPMLTFTMWKMYRTQISVEKAALKKFENSQAVMRAEEQRQQAAQQAQFATQEAVAEESSRGEIEEANEEIPDEVREAA